MDDGSWRSFSVSEANALGHFCNVIVRSHGKIGFAFINMLFSVCDSLTRNICKTDTTTKEAERRRNPAIYTIIGVRGHIGVGKPGKFLRLILWTDTQALIKYATNFAPSFGYSHII